MKKTELLILTLIVSFVATCLAGGSGSIGVSTTPVTVISANNGQTTRNNWFVIQNTSTNTVYLKLDSSTNTLTSTNGISLAGGGSLSVMATAANPAQNNIQAVSSSGTNTLTYQYGNDK